MSTIMLETKQLSKRFGKQAAVAGVSLRVPKNSIYGLLGPNGAGKSTTLKMLTGILRPSSGEILFDGSHWNRSMLKDIGSLIEAPPLYGNLTAFENVKVHALLRGLPTQRIEEVLHTVDLTHTGKKKASQFSMGMKQRLGIAIALLNQPKLLILDEPTNGLDPLGIQELRELITSFPQKGMTVILSSHILSEVQLMADHIGIISEGRLGYQDSIKGKDDLEGLFMEVVKTNRRK
ncbi:lantibiotic ABC transporter ATP-binding protein [Shouchella clausii]|uniref:Lantibiotic ABC transporter ATP-binding protein n=1 Tax=Shouchella clausii (strain KSM-K16) TaxID=66692 RepID=Q5WIQ7_SHOC1|nr:MULTISPECIES: lantibiotic protection ABC transporter ATP-binding protein [Shouchella]MDO7285260.1 lantibiotic protection ABC transporter ATP-binding protein [Shouchella clausii]MDO7305355.1 lantibiotic protection ABC transporter ATP-binding protein [Shouchella clausii]SHL58812.1 ABC-2 type transport system ATP-binding protein [Shouchella rhizosphaerae]BAD63748.1 lantibiotic ABC transporter ATP-binding protein [Shouchella clausii KSM-K16]GIN18047.1 lantibiotic ABC transporter ATP-binding pro